MSHIQSFGSSNDDQEEEGEEEEYDDDEANGTNCFHSQSNDNEEMDHGDSLSDIEEFDISIMSNVSTSTLAGMRIFDSIPHGQHQSFFRVQINGQQKYLHKQTATWYLSKDKMELSSDRLKRVQSK